MKIIFEKSKLLEALTPAAAIVPNKNTNYILECVLLETTDDNRCKITAYDMEKGFMTYIDCEVIEKGSYAINSQNFIQRVRSLPDGEDIEFTINEKKHLILKSGNASFEVGAVPGENYPNLPVMTVENEFSLSQCLFKSLVNKTIFAASQNETGKAFSGLFFKIGNGKIVCVGCDRNMLAKAECSYDEGKGEEKFIIPSKILFELQKTVNDTEDEMSLAVSKKYVIIKIEGFVYFSRLIDEEYFDYEKILSLPGKFSYFTNAKALRESCERASIVSEEKIAGKVKNSIALDFYKDKIKISSVSASGSIYDEIPSSGDYEENMLFKFNCRYIINVLKACDKTETVKVKLSGPKMGMEVTNGDSDIKELVDYRYYIMPMLNNG